MLVQNKIDLAHNAKISDRQIAEVTRSIGLKFFKASVKENVMVEDIFDHIASECFSTLSKFE